jgi:hypothetical protein
MPIVSAQTVVQRLQFALFTAVLVIAAFYVTPSHATHKRGAAHAIINEVFRAQERDRQRTIYVVPKVEVSRARVAEAQRILNLIGYDAGPVDGAMGRRTRAALINFQRNNSLLRTGTVNDPTIIALRRAEAERIAGAQPARPEQQVYQPAAVNSGDVSGLYCAGDHAMALNETDQGDLQFMVSSAQSGHHCQAEGTARRTPYGWRYEANMHGAAGERCAIEFSAAGSVRLSTDADARCQSVCGARATLNGLAFPSGARVTAIPAARLFENDGALFRESCGS